MTPNDFYKKFRGPIHTRYASVSDMARDMNWGRQKLQRITHGEQVPNVYDLAELARALGMSLTDVAALWLEVSA